MGRSYTVTDEEIATAGLAIVRVLIRRGSMTEDQLRRTGVHHELGDRLFAAALAGAIDDGLADRWKGGEITATWRGQLLVGEANGKA